MKISTALGDVISDLEDALAAARKAWGAMVTAHESAIARLREVKDCHDRAMVELAGDGPAAPTTAPAVPTPPPMVAPVVPVVPTPLPVPPAPDSHPLAALTRAPKGRDRYIPEEIWDVADREFRAVGLDPDLGIGLEVWETGWYDGLPSAPAPAWSERNNPGGMKKPPKQFARHGIVYDRDPEHDTYMRFPAWQMGIRAHAVFIGDSELYKAVHSTSDIDRQIEAIGAAGYAEDSDSWVVGVKAKYRQVVSLRAKRAGTRPVTTPAPTDIGAEILVSAKKAQDLGIGFPYEPETEGGNLGCANVVSWILRNAGVLEKIVLNVDGVVDALLAIGWREVAVPYRDGDVIAWKPWAGSGGHQHVGILDEEGVKVWSYNNSSGQRRVVVEDLAGDDRPIRCVLRHP